MWPPWPQTPSPSFAPPSRSLPPAQNGSLSSTSHLHHPHAWIFGFLNKASPSMKPRGFDVLALPTVPKDENWISYQNSSRKPTWLVLNRGQNTVTTQERADVLLLLLHRLRLLRGSSWGHHCGVDGILKTNARDAVSSLRFAHVHTYRDKFLIVDNAYPHNASAMSDKLKKYGIPWLPHPTHAADFSPCDCHAFEQSWGVYEVQEIRQPSGSQRFNWWVDFISLLFSGSSRYRYVVRRRDWGGPIRRLLISCFIWCYHALNTFMES